MSAEDWKKLQVLAESLEEKSEQLNQLLARSEAALREKKIAVAGGVPMSHGSQLLWMQKNAEWSFMVVHPQDPKNAVPLLRSGRVTRVAAAMALPALVQTLTTLVQLAHIEIGIASDSVREFITSVDATAAGSDD